MYITEHACVGSRRPYSFSLPVGEIASPGFRDQRYTGGAECHWRISPRNTAVRPGDPRLPRLLILFMSQLAGGGGRKCNMMIKFANDTVPIAEEVET